MSSFTERASEWRQRLDAQFSSGLSVSAWCRAQGVEKNSFYRWRRRLSEAVCVSGSQFIAVSVDPPDVAEASVLLLRVGLVRIEVASGFDATLLRDVLNVLESRSC